MDPESCSKSISACENSSKDVIVEVQTSDSVSCKVLIEEERDVNKPKQGIENDLRIAKDDVSCSSSSSATQTVHQEVGGSNTVVSCHEAKSDTSKAKEKDYHTIHLSNEGERICRICHFGYGYDESPKARGDTSIPDLIEIGCKCKNELGLAHLHCAEIWFKVRGSCVCEICGCTAKNVTVRLMEEWNQERDTTLDERRRRGRGQSCCIFMVFILSIILLHWFFKKVSGYYQSR